MTEQTVGINNHSNTSSVLPRSLGYIVRKLGEKKDFTPDDVASILREAQVDPSDLKQWSAFDHPMEDSYGRKLVYQGDHFEIMVMSWCPGDFSGIHDHGHAQWGAVQIFGPAEHAVFEIQDNILTTVDRGDVTPGDILKVDHDLIHQMGNPTQDHFFLTLHVYGDVKDCESVTGDARIFDPVNGVVQHVNGGVFFALPESAIVRKVDGPVGDYPTQLRFQTELVRRLLKMREIRVDDDKQITEILSDAFALWQGSSLFRHVEQITDQRNTIINHPAWQVLNRELREAARLQRDLKGVAQAKDQFHKYAEVYDALVGYPALNTFIRKYLFFVAGKYQLDLPLLSLISLGAGTGLTERFMIDELRIQYDKMYGIDISEAMVHEASNRIRAGVGNILTLDPGVRLWDIAYSGLNVFQYLSPEDFVEAVRKTAAVVEQGGYFIGDFIAPDHITRYPNVAYSEDLLLLSLRTPHLAEEGDHLFQDSEIINIRCDGDLMELYDSGKHRRYLPRISQVREAFEDAFGGHVDLYDAYSLQVLPDDAEECASTRYIVVAKKV